VAKESELLRFVKLCSHLVTCHGIPPGLYQLFPPGDYQVIPPG